MINISHGINYLHSQFIEGKISREVMEDLTEYIQTFSMYEGAVRKEMAGGLSEDTAHEAVVNQLIRDLSRRDAKKA